MNGLYGAVIKLSLLIVMPLLYQRMTVSTYAKYCFMVEECDATMMPKELLIGP